MKKLFATSLIFVILLAVSPRAYADSPKPTVTVVPFLQTIQILENEQSRSLDLTLTNNSKQTLKFRLNVLDFGALDETGGVAFASSDSSALIKKYGLSSWLKLAYNNLTLAPGQNAKVNAQIINDASHTPGGHYAAIIASVDSPDTANKNQVNINQRVSALIMATKTGGEKYDLKLNQTNFDTSWLRLPTSVVLRFKNPGNVQVVPRGTVKLMAPGDKLISQGVINEGSSFVLPETFRQLPVELQRVAGPRWWPATYHLQVTYRYDGFDRFAVKDYYIRFINIPALLLIGLILLVTAYVAKTQYKKRWPHHKRRHH